MYGLISTQRHTDSGFVSLSPFRCHASSSFSRSSISKPSPSIFFQKQNRFDFLDKRSDFLLSRIVFVWFCMVFCFGFHSILCVGTWLAYWNSMSWSKFEKSRARLWLNEEEEEVVCRNVSCVAAMKDVVEEKPQNEVNMAIRKCFPVVNGGLSTQHKGIIVGYALTTKKARSFLQPKLERLARNKGILFVPIDVNVPLSDQGPFDILLHKLSGKEWRQVLEDYGQTHPEVTVLDPPDAIQRLRSRQYMLQAVADLNLSDSFGTVGVPRQLVIMKDASCIPDMVKNAGFKLPLVAKPLVADGSRKSHELSLAYDLYSLQNLEPPLVIQEFVNHGGILFKVYIVGDAIKVVRRFSLPDINKRELSENTGIFRFPRVSCAAASADDADLDPSVAELPPRPLLEKLAKDLRRRLGLCLFNLDMMREYGTRDQFYVIDINYFPGFGKMPDYEYIFTDFLTSLVRAKYKKK